MVLTTERDKDLPAIPVDVDAEDTRDRGTHAMPFAATPANTSKMLPSVNIENTLSEEEMCRLHELWNGAGLSAREYRRKRRDQSHGQRQVPAPISIPEPEDVLSTLVVSSTDPPTTGTRRRWGLLSARPFSESREAEKRATNALEKLRTMAQDRLRRKLRYARSAPNLGGQTVSSRQGVTHELAVLTPAESVPKDNGASGPRNLMPPEAVAQQEDTDENAIYFTIDPDWRASQGSVRFEPITPVPDSQPLSGRPDSPLLHRHHSLNQLSFAATQQASAMELAEEYPTHHGVLDPIDELHAYLELPLELN